MNGSLFERYKDALRRGHIATLEGRADEAIGAYEEAAGLAPDRALPHASRGGVLARAGRLEDAVAAFRRALDLAAGDEAALAGLADALLQSGDEAGAADALVRLAERRAAAGHPADAAGAARRAITLLEAGPRRGLVGRIMGWRGDAAAAADALRGRAERLLATPRDAVAPGGGAEAPPSVPGASLELLPAVAPGPPDPEGLLAAADAANIRGDAAAALEGYRAAASAFRAEGRFDAALDAGLPALALAPADPAIHLTMADVYLDRGWRDGARDKLALVRRLAELDGDEATAGAARRLAAERVDPGPGEPSRRRPAAD